MNMIVLLSRTVSPEEELKVENGQISMDESSYIINPPDCIALEEALQLKELYGGTITVVMVGPHTGEKQLRTALAMGADKAVLMDIGDEKSNSSLVAKIIGAYISSLDYDLILAGDFSTDGATGQVGPRVATILNIPYLTNTIKIEQEKNKVSITRRSEFDVETYEGQFPLLVTIPQSLHVPRLVSIAGVIKAKKKAIDFNFVNSEKKSFEYAQNYSYAPLERNKHMIQGDNSTKVAHLAQIIKQELP